MNHFQASPRKAAKRKKALKAKAITLFTQDAPLYTAIAICLAPTAGLIGAAGIAGAAYLYTKFAK